MKSLFEGTIMMQHRNVRIVGIIGCIALAGFVGCDKPQLGKSKKAELKADPIRVNVTVDTAARRTLFLERKLLGTLAPFRETDLAPQAPGRVKSLPVQIGDYVAAGQIVARMDDASLVATDAQFQQVAASYERMKSLYESNAIPKAQYEAVAAQYAAMKRQIENLQENTVITAPFSGVVTAKAVEAGELYSGGMMPGQSKGLIHIAQLDPLKVDLELDDQTVRFIKKGMAVRITNDQIPDTVQLFGKVEYVNPQADMASRAFGARVIVPNKDRLLRPGYFAEVHVVLGEKKDVLTVPRQAVVDECVFVVTDSIAFSRKVTLGWLTDTYAELVSGVNDRDIVVIGGNKALPDNAWVNVVSK
jgi:RND family efflux transporter MFP subunit